MTSKIQKITSEPVQLVEYRVARLEQKLEHVESDLRRLNDEIDAGALAMFDTILRSLILVAMLVILVRGFD
jgi:hypothetical protein